MYEWVPPDIDEIAESIDDVRGIPGCTAARCSETGGGIGIGIVGGGFAFSFEGAEPGGEFRELGETWFWSGLDEIRG